MKYPVFLLVLLLLFKSGLVAQSAKEPWKEQQLIAPRALAEQIDKKQTGNILILSVGPDAVIRGSVDMGPAHEPEHFAKLKSYLKNVSRNKEVIIYCGCCPFDKCPNIRPAFKTLTGMGFKKARLLNIPKNIKADWLDKDYPTNDNE
ncbi:hypothetical protein [Niabella drilacis]|nr:hypothetical protein [Niabella drilacis]